LIYIIRKKRKNKIYYFKLQEKYFIKNFIKKLDIIKNIANIMHILKILSILLENILKISCSYRHGTRRDIIINIRFYTFFRKMYENG